MKNGLDLKSPEFWPVYPFPKLYTRVTWALALTSYCRNITFPIYADKIWEQREIEAGLRAKVQLDRYLGIRRYGRAA